MRKATTSSTGASASAGIAEAAFVGQLGGIDGGVVVRRQVVELVGGGARVQRAPLLGVGVALHIEVIVSFKVVNRPLWDAAVGQVAAPTEAIRSCIADSCGRALRFRSAVLMRMICNHIVCSTACWADPAAPAPKLFGQSTAMAHGYGEHLQRQAAAFGMACGHGRKLLKLSAVWNDGQPLAFDDFVYARWRAAAYAGPTQSQTGSQKGVGQIQDSQKHHQRHQHPAPSAFYGIPVRLAPITLAGVLPS